MKEQKRAKSEKSGILGFFAAVLAFPARVLSLFAATPLGRFFTGYEGTRAHLLESRLANDVRRSSLYHRARPARSSFTNAVSKSKIPHIYHTVTDTLRYTESRMYGILFGTFGLYTVLVYFIKHFVATTVFNDTKVLITGIGVMLISLPLLLSGRPICLAVQENVFLERLLFDVFEMRRATRVRKGSATINATLAFIIGSALGIVGFFVHPLYLVGGICILLFLWLLLSSPEFSLFAAIFSAPFLIFFEHPTFLLGVIVLIGSASYFFKVVLGKRTFTFGPMDVMVFLLAMLYAASSLFSFGGLESALRALAAAVLMLGYFLAANLLTSRRTLRHAINTLLTSAGAVALIGLVQQAAGKAIADWLDHRVYDYISGRITSVFENPNVLAVFLILMLPFAAAGFLRRGRFGGRIFSFVTFLLCLCAVVYTWSRGAWLGVILSLLLFLFACKPATVYLLVPLAAGIPLILTTSVGKRLASILSLSDSSISYRLSIWRGALSMAGDHVLGGLGVGEGAFSSVFPYYAPAGVEGATHAHNLLLQMLCELGILGPILFVFFTTLFFQRVVSHQAEEGDEEFRLYSLAAGCGVFAVLINGLFDYVFYNSRIFFLFFVVVGIAVALSRVGRTERERAKPISDTAGTAAVLDISLS